MNTIRNVATAAAVAAVTLFAPATAYADDTAPAPEAGDECTRAELGDVVDVDGGQLECVRDPENLRRFYWQPVEDEETPGEDDDSEDDESDEGQDDEDGTGEDDDSEDEGADEGSEEDDGNEDEGTDEEVEDDGNEPDCVDVNTADAETLRMLRHVDQDRAAQIIALRPFDSFDDLDRVNGLRVGGPRLAELIRGGGEWLPLCPIEAEDEGEDQKPADEDEDAPADSSNGSLPVTGAALAALITTGVLTLGGGGTAMVLARRRRATQ